jgi:hypothetical protein
MKKNSGKAPAYQMYPMDWNEDTELKMCSYAAEGLWIRLTNTSYGMPVKGVFVKKINGGKAITLLNQTDNQQVNLLPLKLSEIASLLRGETEEKLNLLNELTANNVLKRLDDGEYKGAFYVKRLYEDMKLRAIRQEAGKHGGNPNLVGNLLNQNVNQKTTPSSSSSSSISLTNNLASLLLQKITERKPDFKKPSLEQWEKHIDSMIRIDKRKPEIIEKVIIWCQADCGDGGKWKGWQNNILSTAKLREKFDKLELAMNKTQKPKNETPKCFVCKTPTNLEILTGKQRQPICLECNNLLAKSPPFKNYKGAVIPKTKLEPSQLEAMILKQKAAR